MPFYTFSNLTQQTINILQVEIGVEYLFLSSNRVFVVRQEKENLPGPKGSDLCAIPTHCTKEVLAL